MQEIKNKRRSFLLVILLITTGVVVWYSRREHTSGVNKDQFRIEALAQVDKIVMRSQTDTIMLNYNGTRWKVSDTWYADRDMIEVLFATLQQAAPRRPVGASQQDSLYKSLEQTGVLVEAFIKGVSAGKFWSGGNASKTQAYFADPDDKQVFIMNIPGYRVYVSGIFELNESGWREKRVFAFNWQNFQNLEAVFPGRPEQNFSVIMKDMQASIPGMVNIDTARLNDFMDAVSLLTVDEYRNNTPSLDSLLSVGPIQVLTVSDIGKRNFTLKVYRGRDLKFKGLINETQWADFDTEKLSRVVVPKDFFARQ
jgi:hypothetical protein